MAQEPVRLSPRRGRKHTVLAFYELAFHDDCPAEMQAFEALLPHFQEAPMILQSEFARVTVELDNRGNGPRLMSRDDRSQRAISLGLRDLSSLARCAHQDLAPLVDQGRMTPEDDQDGDTPEARLGDLDLKP